MTENSPPEPWCSFLWRENPNDDIAYRYIKYQAMVDYLLEKERTPWTNCFTRSFDEK